MGKKKKVKTPSWQSQFTILGSLGDGGNAQVYEVLEAQSGNHFALKELVNRNAEKKSRFLSEIKVTRDNFNEIPGILPIIHYNSSDFWYTMPIAEKIMARISDLEIKNIVLGTIELCDTLILLHAKGISHRDIKPANIYFYNNRFTFADFGLVDFPDNAEHHTTSDKWLGAIFTIAPEMKRNPKAADGKKADVYSLAKTFWMLLSADDKGFDGAYNYLDPNHSLRTYPKCKGIHIVEIEELLKDATNNNPNLRPTAEEFKQRLQNWIDIFEDKDKSQASAWGFLRKELFGAEGEIPDSARWTTPETIVSVLNRIGRTNALNHMHFSDGGGLDFVRAETAPELGCIRVYDDSGECSLVKPKSLEYEGFRDDICWNYFILDLETLEPVFSEPEVSDCERLIEDYPGHYVDAKDSVYGVYDYDTGKPLPPESLEVFRYIKGRFLFVMKYGHYNHLNVAYDGRHGKFSSTASFRQYVDFLAENYSLYYSAIQQVAKDTNTSLKDIDYFVFQQEIFRYNPFQSRNAQDAENDKLMNEIDIMQKEEKFVELNLNKWNFLSLLPSQDVNVSNVRYFFTLHSSRGRDFSEFLDRSELYLCQDGTVCKLREPDETKCFFVTDRSVASEVKRCLQQGVRKNIAAVGLESSGDNEKWVSIKMRRAGAPTHLFTREEIEVAMRSADDRRHNKLVVDENGFVSVIEGGKLEETYAVVHETWCAGNNYVGKYSPLSTLDEDYLLMLDGWLDYLHTGEDQFPSYLSDEITEEILLNEIKPFYAD